MLVYKQDFKCKSYRLYLKPKPFLIKCYTSKYKLPKNNYKINAEQCMSHNNSKNTSIQNMWYINIVI